ncbi:hypothetical protein P389DRAFT_146453, partial [Cystobasidium minutum MCA 4210]|uniref:uncharacterized protein n=1 Tax=Cystobasidium minutum MCA 4210 TaxID=1397322 RepID=UPI0034CDA795
AMQLIDELNTTVFKGQLPEDLTVVWNGRLNTTAGRANWRKYVRITQKSTNTTIYKAEIELSVKVIDSEEKLKCTLSHELCHVAAWAIDKEMKPAHGAAFTTWGKKIMRCRSDIKVTTKHTYEIAYKYSWQCTNPACQKIYGRHSKSVDPARHACGVCSGKLARLDKNGLPVAEAQGAAGTPRKESEWAVFSKVRCSCSLPCTGC